MFVKDSILLTGATGLLGGMCLWRWRKEPLALTALVRDPAKLPADAWPGVKVVAGDLASPDNLSAAVRTVGPGLVVHCAALTKVDYCQKEPALAQSVNVEASGVLAAAAREQGASFVHISTDAVYASGKGLHSEEDVAGELSVYATTKLKGENAVIQACPDALILRTCMIGWNQDPARSSLAEWIVATLSEGKVVPGFTDVRFSPLFTATLADLILIAAGIGINGVFNLGSRDGLSKYATACLIAQGMGRSIDQVSPVKQSQADLAIPRPQDPLMDSKRIFTALNREAPTLSKEVDGFLEMERGGELAAFRRFGGFL